MIIQGTQKKIWKALEDKGRRSDVAGIGEGVHMTLTRRMHDRYKAKGLRGEGGAMRCILSGATWPAKRKAECGMIESDQCPKCQEGIEDTEHRWWNCPAYEDIRREHDIKFLVRSWEAEVGTIPGCFKHCGIVNKEMVKKTWSNAMRETDTAIQEEKMQCDKAWTDGSGSHSKDVIKRRAGWGVVSWPAL